MMSAAIRRITSIPHAVTKACIDLNSPAACRPISTGPSHSGEADDYFLVLQVNRKATAKEVQAAFKQAARLCHPDLHRSDPTAEQRFRKCLLAYQVLTDPEARKCHELALDCSASPGLRRAASTMAFRYCRRRDAPDKLLLRMAEVEAATRPMPCNGLPRPGAAIRRTRDEREQCRSRAAAAYDLGFWEALSPSHWRAIASAEAALTPPSSASLPSKAASHLARELETSLHQVYFGPDISDLPADQLPPAFEAEHRSHPWATDLLQLVSGRTLLGSVRCRHPAALPASSPRHAPGSAVGEAEVSPEHHGARGAGDVDLNPSTGSSVEHVPYEDNIEASTGANARPSWAAWGHMRLETLEAMWTQATNDADKGAAAPGIPASSDVPAPRELVFSVSGEDQVMAVIQGSGEGAGEWVDLMNAESREVQGFILGDMVADAQGMHTHTIMSYSTPGVMHTALFSMAARRVVFRATRTWLPDPQYWFVPPRTRDYDSGGWYIEWVGHEQASRAGWLHPGVACMILAMQALKVERGQGPWWLRRTRHEQITAR